MNKHQTELMLLTEWTSIDRDIQVKRMNVKKTEHGNTKCRTLWRRISLGRTTEIWKYGMLKGHYIWRAEGKSKSKGTLSQKAVCLSEELSVKGTENQNGT